MGAQDASKVIRGQEGLPQLTKVWCVDAEAYTPIACRNVRREEAVTCFEEYPHPWERYVQDRWI